MNPQDPDPNNPPPSGELTPGVQPDLSSVLQSDPPVTPTPPPPAPDLSQPTTMFQPSPPQPPTSQPPVPIQPEPVSSSFDWSSPATQPPTQSWANPVQPEPIMPQGEPPTPTFTPPEAQTYNTIPDAPSPTESAPVQPETAPTDLSQLAAQMPETPPTFAPPVSQPETLVTSPGGLNGGIDVPNIPMESGGGIPKWVIGLALGLVIVVAGTSAYFILGIGKNTPDAQSLPATTQDQQTLTDPPQQLPPHPLPATSSASFGQFGSSGTSTTPAATSAAELLRQRQGR